jgi:hypothetical protein
MLVPNTPVSPVTPNVLVFPKSTVTTTVGTGSIKGGYVAGFIGIFILCLTLKGDSVSNDKQNRGSSAIRLQLPTDRETITSNVKINNTQSGVRKNQGFQGLLELYADATAKEPGLAKCKEFRDAIIKMSQTIKRTQGFSEQGKNVAREEFRYNGKIYRIDLENL